MTQDELLSALVQKVDPIPKEEIEKEIENYMNHRTARWFRSENQSREAFLNAFITTLNSPDHNLTQSIRTMCDGLLFRNDWKESVGKSLSQEFPELSLNNPLLNNLKLIEAQGVQPKQKQLTFNNPFLTAYFRKHVPLKETSKNVALNLMRWMVINSSNDTTARIEKLAKETLQELALNRGDEQVLLFSSKLVELQNQINELKPRELCSSDRFD